MYYWFLQFNWMNDKKEPGISHLKGEKGKKCTRIKLQLNLMKHNDELWLSFYVDDTM